MDYHAVFSEDLCTRHKFRHVQENKHESFKQIFIRLLLSKKLNLKTS